MTALLAVLAITNAVLLATVARLHWRVQQLEQRRLVITVQRVDVASNAEQNFRATLLRHLADNAVVPDPGATVEEFLRKTRGEP